MKFINVKIETKDYNQSKVILISKWLLLIKSNIYLVVKMSYNLVVKNVIH